VRTDLGGIYFNLLLVLGVIGLYLVTGNPVLVLFILLLDLQILDEFAPFARFDGYWTLADMTGIPDFFSEMGPFLRTVLPVPWWKGPRLPNLKGWVKAVFGIYIVVTVPLLSYLLWLMVTHLPATLAAIWQALGQQIAAFSTAWAAGKGLGMVQASMNILPLVLSTCGILVVLTNVGYQLGGLLWRWSKPTPLRRTIGVVLASTALMGLGVEWVGLPALWRLASTQRGVSRVVDPANAPPSYRYRVPRRGRTIRAPLRRGWLGLPANSTRAWAWKASRNCGASSLLRAPCASGMCWRPSCSARAWRCTTIA
jgi:putative peptide zinc metalloprotease protein